VRSARKQLVPFAEIDVIYLGIDCGTQGTKAVLFEPDSGRIIGRGNAPHAIISDASGRREQKTEWWIEALKTAVHAALRESGRAPADVAAIAVSGQQHGLIMIDGRGSVLRDVKLWNDTETAPENEMLIAELGGPDRVWDLISTTLPVGYTASKVRWVMKHEPEIYAKMGYVLLPHDYLNYWLTGEIVMEAGEASGTGFFDVASRAWSTKMVEAIDPSGILARALPPIVSPREPIGTVRKAVAEEFGLSPHTLVACGSGDNVMGAVGTASVSPGRVTMGLGTSGVINLHSNILPRDADRSIQVFCAVEEGWLPTTCTMNATSSTSLLQSLFEIKIERVEALIAEGVPGAEGIRIFPYFNGERMPPLPHARAVMQGLSFDNFTRANLMRAMVESVAFSLKWGFEKISGGLGQPAQFRLTGGGANSGAWRQILADVFDTEVVRVKWDEGGAFGAALLALAVDQRHQGISTSLRAVCDHYVDLDFAKSAQPRPAVSSIYRELYEEFCEMLRVEFFSDEQC
jgi:xylulokinase